MVEGVVVGEPDARDAYTNLRVEADQLIIADQPTRTVKGLVLIQAPPFTDFRYGDRVRAEDKLQTPTNTGDFDYQEHLARQDVYSIMSRSRVTTLARDQGFTPLGWLFAFKVRATLTRVVAQILPGPQASPLTGILLGDDAATRRRLSRVCKRHSAVLPCDLVNRAQRQTSGQRKRRSDNIRPAFVFSNADVAPLDPSGLPGKRPDLRC